MNIGFWNVNRKDLDGLVAEFAQAKTLDVVILAENGDSNAKRTLGVLQGTVDAEFSYPGCTSNRLQVFVRRETFGLAEAFADCGGRLSIRRMTTSWGEVSLAIVHLPSKVNYSDSSQSQYSQDVARLVANYEARVQHSRTIVVGDFNMNPFETGVVGAGGFHSSMRLADAKEGRTVLGEHYRFYYNPMWSMMGDRSAGPPGTHYYRNAEHVSYDWNMFDQVLLRPEIADRLTGVEIATSVGSLALATPAGRPDKRNASDHFPLSFSLRAV